MSIAPREWIERLQRALGADGPEDDRWGERMLLHATGELTATEEYVVRHGVMRRKRDGDPVPEAVERGEWSADLEEEFHAEGSRAEVERGRSRLEAAGLIRREAPESDGGGRGGTGDDEGGDGDRDATYWRLTDAGRAERDRAMGQFEAEFEELAYRHGVLLADWLE